MMTILWFLLSLATPQHHDAHAPAAGKPATLMTGLGRLHHPIATRSADAQRFFDQGLTLVYGFNHEEAVRAFRRAAELDPASPMPHWGIALALGPNINLDVDPDREKAAYDEAQRARALAASAPASERAYVEAVAKRYSNDPGADLKALAVQYTDAMKDLIARYPDDLDAATLYAESLMDLHPKAGAIAAWKRAVAAEDALNYDEPADWFYPTRESLGAALLRTKRTDEAAQVFRDDLARNPKNGRSLFGLWQAQLARKDPAAAATEKQFKRAWKRADTPLRIADF